MFKYVAFAYADMKHAAHEEIFIVETSVVITVQVTQAIFRTLLPPGKPRFTLTQKIAWLPCNDWPSFNGRQSSKTGEKLQCSPTFHHFILMTINTPSKMMSASCLRKASFFSNQVTQRPSLQHHELKFSKIRLFIEKVVCYRRFVLSRF